MTSSRFVISVVVAITTSSCSSDESSTKGASGGSGGSGGAAGSSGVDAGADVQNEAALPEPFTIKAFDAVSISSDSTKPNFQSATTDVDWGTGPFAEVKLVVDLATTCYPFETWSQNPPPAGQNWPADCDAFDRNFEFHLDPPADEKLGPPAIELIRAITPFGGPLHLETDITDVANGRPGSHSLRVVITTWSDAAGQVSGSNGGWNVTAQIQVTPGQAPRKVLALVPLYDASVTSAAPLAPIDFEMPSGTTTTRLEYRVTGHGGVIGASGCGLQPAEEFCLRTHALFADEKVFTDVMPWRDDCDKLCTIAHQGTDGGGFDYCKENPCGAIQSVKAPRANWCPGSETPPYVWDQPEFRTPGSHSFRFQIADIADGGSWRVSATLFAFGS